MVQHVKYADLHEIPPPQLVLLAPGPETKSRLQLYASGAIHDRESGYFVVDGARFMASQRFYKQWPLIKVINGMHFVDDRLPGEDRRFGGNHLTFDMIPRRCSFRNVRAAVSPADWSTLGAIIHARAGNRCECCARAPGSRTSFATGQDLVLHCHEKWEFDYENNRQTLKRLVSLCDECHASTHLGHSFKSGYGPAAAAHFAWVRGITPQQAKAEFNKAYADSRQRDRLAWDIDISIIKNAGITTATPEEFAATVRSIAEARMGEETLEDATYSPSSGPSPG